MVNIRNAVIEDINNNLLELYISGFKMHYDGRSDIFDNLDHNSLKNNLNKLFEDNIKKIFVLEVDDNIIGYVVFQIRDRVNKSIWIDELFIDSNYRKNGYGKLFMDYISDYALKNDCVRVELNCWAFNEGANKFYESLGYSVQRIVYEKKFSK